jgi:hypothetical protein
VPIEKGTPKMRELTEVELMEVNGGTVTTSEVLYIGSGITAVGAAVLGAAIVMSGGGALLVAGATAYSVISAGLALSGALVSASED